MIKVTRLKGKEFYVNPHQIEFMEATPDCVITMLSEKKLVISESVEEIIDRIIEYRQKLGDWHRDEF